jgi:hypothetical protein
MTYVLLNRKESGRPTIIRQYSTRRGALVGMRISNRNAGWARIGRRSSGIYDMEWCAKTNGLPIYDYAPYVIAEQCSFEHAEYLVKFPNK